MAAQRGDREAFGELVRRYGPAARRVARAVLHHPEDADDAAQDGFFSAWRNINRYDSGRQFGPWILRIVVNAAHDLRRRRQIRETDPVSPQLPGGEESPAALVEQGELGERIDRALQSLPERQRLAVVLFDAEGFSHGEIAQMLGIPEGTVRSDVFHARRALRTRLGLEPRGDS
ncbi:MAG TPA: sigma-70 family RNA polymerase sigma factor [Gemmatimonadales bacterium]|nr:sigma-70 family RNA polymerase sigma factor [Gemmatimonadales bacterium]HSE67221.1 sigma-70 family RNA polymerase sigma factor [Gemmatimonadales bacterium]